MHLLTKLLNLLPLQLGKSDYSFYIYPFGEHSKRNLSRFAFSGFSFNGFHRFKTSLNLLMSSSLIAFPLTCHQISFVII